MPLFPPPLTELPSTSPTDTDLLAFIGFRSLEEQQLIVAFAQERGMSVRALLAQALRVYHTQTVVGPEYMIRCWLGKGDEAPPKVLRPLPPSHPDYRPVGCPDLGD